MDRLASERQPIVVKRTCAVLYRCRGPNHVQSDHMLTNRSERAIKGSLAIEPAIDHPSLTLTCGNCGRGVSLEYAAGPRPVQTVYFCPSCYKANRLEVPGQIRGIRKLKEVAFR